MTIISRTAPKFCVKTRAERAEVFFLTPIPYGISGNVEPWSECQPRESRPREARPEYSSIYIYIYIYIYMGVSQTPR